METKCIIDSEQTLQKEIDYELGNALKSLEEQQKEKVKRDAQSKKQVSVKKIEEVKAVKLLSL